MISKHLVVLVLSATFLGGCTPKHGSQPVLAVIAIDVSCKEPNLLMRYADFAYRLQRTLPANSLVKVYVFGTRCFPVYEGRQLRSRDLFNLAIGTKLTKLPEGLSGNGTHTELAVEALVADARSTAQPTVAAILTDGGMEDLRPTIQRSLAGSVAQLKGRPRLRQLSVIGVHPEFRAQWSAWLSPLANRGRVCGDFELDHASAFVGQEILR